MSNAEATEHVAAPAGTEGNGQQPGEAAGPVSVATPWAMSSGPSLPMVDTDDNDGDSAVTGLDAPTSTVSLRSSIYEHVEENGRTYHKYKQGKYPLPNDEQEQERLDLQHALFGVTLEKRLYLAPINDNCHNVLDIATGTGIWAIEFAHQHPSARVVGTDLSPIQPEYVPANCRFEIDDMEDEWNFSERFDFIHGRALVSCLKDPEFVLAEAFKSLVPGGYLELQDGTFPHQYIGTPPVDSAFYKWNTVCPKGAAKMGRPWTHAARYKEIMEAVGFEAVVEKRFYWPTSRWPKGEYLKTVASYWQEDLIRGCEGIGMVVLTKGLGWSAEEVKALCDEVKRELRETKLYAWLPIYVVYGRKPLGTAQAETETESASVAEAVEGVSVEHHEEAP